MGKGKAGLYDLSVVISADTAMLFDLDGTLVDTNLANFLSYSQAIREITGRQLDATFHENRRFNRADLNSVIPSFDELQIQKIISLKAEIYKDLLSKTKLNCALAELLRTYSLTNRTVLVTGCEKDRAMMVLRYHGVDDCFKEFVFHSNSNRKSGTHKYDAALVQLSLNPKSVLVFENDDADIENAVQAGVPRGNILTIL